MADAKAIRAFEHAGCERQPTPTRRRFAIATRPFISPLLDAAEVQAGQSMATVADMGRGAAP